jgi:hypothetical protein
MTKVKTRAISETEQWRRWHGHVDAKLREIEAIEADEPAIKRDMADSMIRGVFRSMGWGDIANRLEKLQSW